MDKNIAAILRKDTRTVEVKFATDNATGVTKPSDNKHYTYVTTLDLKVDDLVVVAIGDTAFKVVTVVAVHDDCEIPPNDSRTYSWIVCRLDLRDFEENLRRNAKIVSAIEKKYKESMRQQFRDEVLAGLVSDSFGDVAAIIGMEKHV